MSGVPSDHPSVETVHAHLEKSGATDRLRVAIPAEDSEHFPEGDVVRAVLDSHERFVRVDTHLTEDRVLLPGAYDDPAFARNPAGHEDRLAAWADENQRSAGDAVLVDVLDAGHRYGLRTPGERVVYEDHGEQSGSLADIARDLDG